MAEGAGGGRPQGEAMPPPPPQIVARQAWKQVQQTMVPTAAAAAQDQNAWSPYKGRPRSESRPQGKPLDFERRLTNNEARSTPSAILCSHLREKPWH